ncbi:hypothetical protein E2C01_065036 [Portunus trituberculatus]|uniref:Uncharacterized protein n=1 Tax=Portunus trituberculatus TaxID=210409 RepID=A0A5B7HLX5_PORTR|nr:hypothetical protein [Portunus trituberculatus]
MPCGFVVQVQQQEQKQDDKLSKTRANNKNISVTTEHPNHNTTLHQLQHSSALYPRTAHTSRKRCAQTLSKHSRNHHNNNQKNHISP